MKSSNLHAKIYQAQNILPETWVIEAINTQSGEIFIAQFSNDCAKKLAIEYASAKYQSFSMANI